MYHVVAATTNPAKIQAITLAFDAAFGAGQYRIEGIDVDSGVPEQPLGSTQTRSGARHRVICARQLRPEADFWVGIEAGIEDNMTFAWMSVENHGHRGESRSASLTLPDSVMDGIRQGQTLGHEMRRLSGIDDINRREGAIGIFTQGRLSRTSVYYQALLLALAALEPGYHREPPPHYA
ncbi:inosine/xanthosine triphosphatase [Edwardsiella piscicida]|uniref:inosine/xanthosine triphosphatase n=1 Tax=Edwardsiella piscicida TaxID=1263550 RepID=UPI00084C4D00|nr:inosine/xanthosine triphosphatase [Edwardsiella piscicida]AOP42047.1 inosine/xanthosine triphosphatase [Edwardsiella piscicida]EKS7766647.1 inosine/xanthosine triphosphatase [Edwardsiella piscicida]EKS7813664.1 inosine/xanthosine triphosphatase [Edwardsiella piscicida]UCQ21614.1 inosine/xanthosine triphosphatase [Edwardsiella piscicida]UCQ31799.1 inosine/xanthosine triphosphatase [Edwardsiella piscicida]